MNDSRDCVLLKYAHSGFKRELADSPQHLASHCARRYGSTSELENKAGLSSQQRGQAVGGRCLCSGVGMPCESR